MTRRLPGNVVRRTAGSRGVVCLVIGALCTLAAPSPAAAQMVMDGVSRLPFNRPEAWALKYFTASSLLSGLETPHTEKPGAVSVGMELGTLTPLTEAEQLVGYYGTEAQDLNKAPFFLRPRVAVALPARFSVIVAFVPPVRMFGITPRLLAVGVERPVFESRAWAVGVRGYGQLGHVQGSYTCPSSALAFEPGSIGNADGCQAASSDVAMLRYAGGEASVAYRPETPHALSPHAAVGITYMNVEFQVNALTFGMIDHTRYLSHGVTPTFSAGVSYQLSGRFGFGVDVFYAPLSVSRQFGAPSQNDGLFNARALVTYRLRR